MCLLAVTSCAPETATTPSSVSPATTAAVTPQMEKEGMLAALPFTTIARQAPLGDEPGDPLYTLVVGAGGWNALPERLPDRAIDAASRAGLSEDDLVVVAFAGAQDTRGHSVAIESIVRKDNTLIISVAHTSPAPGEVVEPASTVPYHLAIVRGKDLGEPRSLAFTFRDAQAGTLSRGTVSRP
jgi:hypothetical protein